MPASPHRKLNVPLPEEMHTALFDEARRSGEPATRLARAAINDWLERRARERRNEQVRQFALEHAGSEVDLDPVLESVAAEELMRFDEDSHETR